MVDNELCIAVLVNSIDCSAITSLFSAMHTNDHDDRFEPSEHEGRRGRKTERAGPISELPDLKCSIEYRIKRPAAGGGLRYGYQPQLRAYTAHACSLTTQSVLSHIKCRAIFSCFFGAAHQK